MGDEQTSRKQLFRAALSLAGVSATGFAAQHGISAGYLSMILSGQRPHDEINTKIDELIAKHLISRSTTAIAS